MAGNLTYSSSYKDFQRAIAKIFKNFKCGGYSSILKMIYHLLKNGGIFWGHRVMQMRSEGAVKSWKVLDFVLPRLFNTAILVHKMFYNINQNH